MPFTFFAHQAPVLPLARRWPRRVDGVALVVGSMGPDLAFVLAGTGWELDAHRFPAWALFAVPVTIAVSWLVVRVLAPVVPDHLPDLAPFHLHDYRGLAAHRFRPVGTVVGAVLGVLSHLALDSFTHSWGWFARHSHWWATPLVDDWLGRPWPPYKVLQYVLHVVGTAACLWLLARCGRARWMADPAASVPPTAPTRRSHARLWTATAVGFLGGALWSALAFDGKGPLVMRTAGGVFAGLAVGALLVRRTADRAAAVPAAVAA